MTIRARLAALAALFVCAALAAGCARPQPARPPQPDAQPMLHLCCCMGSRDQAEAYAASLREKLPGLTTQIRPATVSENGGPAFTVYNVYVRHERLSATQIPAALGETGCPTPDGPDDNP